MPHMKYEVNQSANFRGDKRLKNGLEKMKEKLAKMEKLLNQHNFHNCGRDPPQYASHKI